MKCKKIVSLFLALIMVIGIFVIPVNAEDAVKVLLDGQELIFDVPPQLIDNRTMVPMRKIFEAMGASVEWNGNTQTVTATKDDIMVIMQIDNKEINVNGESITFDVAPQLVDSRTLVPARAVAESLKAKVDWDGETRTVIIKYKTLQNEDANMKVNEIWEMENRNEFVINMYLYIAEKCGYGDAMHSLNDEQRVFYITQNLEMEVNNGGFSQFYCNTDGMFVNELVESFEKIGAIKTAEICKKAVSIFGDVPVDMDKINDILNIDDEKIEEKNSTILNECDMAFYEYEEDLEELNYQFIMKNKNSFLK